MLELPASTRDFWSVAGEHSVFRIGHRLLG